MALFEFDEGRLIPAQFGRSVSGGLTPEVVDAVCNQVLEIVSRPLFPITWRDISPFEAQAFIDESSPENEAPRLTALDPSGQVVSVEILDFLDSDTLIQSLSRLAGTAALSWSDLAREYPGGVAAFKSGWLHFRDSMPPSPGAGPRLVRMVAPTAAGAGSEAGSGSGVAAETGADSGSGSRGGAHGKAPARDRRAIPMFARVLAAAAAAVALFTAGIGVGRWTTMTSMESTSHYAALNQAQDVRRSTDTMPDGHVVTLTWSPEMGMTAITTPSALRAPEGQVMQVWARHGNTVESLGVYERRGGDYSFVDIMPQPGSEIFLTFEPQGGSAQPTGEPLVVLRVGAPDPAPTPGGAPSPSTAPTWDGGRSSDGQSGAV